MAKPKKYKFDEYDDYDESYYQDEKYSREDYADDYDDEDYGGSEYDDLSSKREDYFKSMYDEDEEDYFDDEDDDNEDEDEDDEMRKALRESDEDEELLRELEGIDIDSDEFDEENPKPVKTKKKRGRKKKVEVVGDNIDFSTPKNAKVDHRGPAVKARFYSIMEDYHSGDEAKRQYALERAMREMEGFIHLIIKRSYSTYTKKYFYDLLQEGYLGVAIGMNKYNPDISMPSTFFFPYIKHEMQGFITRNVDKTTSHYSSNIKKINKAIEMLEEKGIQYTNVDIAIQTGMTIETVDQSLAIRNCRDEVHIDACPPNVIDAELENSRAKTPEQEYMEIEEKATIYRTMKTLLTDDEIKILQFHFGLDDQNGNSVDIKSEGDIAKTLGMPKDKVKRILNRAIRKLRQSELSNIYSDSVKKENKFLEEVVVPTIPREATKQDIEFLTILDDFLDA
jgi:RNA polymerase sigma factor (sigma-70 family)